MGVSLSANDAELHAGHQSRIGDKSFHSRGKHCVERGLFCSLSGRGVREWTGIRGKLDIGKIASVQAVAFARSPLRYNPAQVYAPFDANHYAAPNLAPANAW
jgi:hypothetical protein